MHATGKSRSVGQSSRLDIRDRPGRPKHEGEADYSGRFAFIMMNDEDVMFMKGGLSYSSTCFGKWNETASNFDSWMLQRCVQTMFVPGCPSKTRPSGPPPGSHCQA